MGTVLVAEDSRTIRTVCEWVFKGSDVELVVVESGDEAVQAMQSQDTDVLVLDYTLPDQDAYELCRTLKSGPDASNTAILMLGGSFAEFDEDKATQCGADDSILKPFHTDELFEKVAVLKERAQAGGARSLGGGAPQQPAQPPQQQPPASQPSQQAQPEQESSAKGRFQFPSRGGSAPPRRFSFPSGGKKSPPQKQDAQQQQAATPAGPTEATPAPTTPPSGTAATAASQAPAQVPANAAGQVDPAMVRAEVQKAVKEMLPGIVRGVLKELITKEVTPQLQRWVEGKVETLVTRLVKQKNG